MSEGAPGLVRRRSHFTTGRQLARARSPPPFFNAFHVIIEEFGFVLPKGCDPLKTINCSFNYCNQPAVGMSHRRLEWQTFAGIALAVHSGPSPAIV